MQYSDFLGQVQARAKLPTQEDAVKITRATLETLSERLAGNEANNVADQLPEEIGLYMRNKNGGERFNLDEFFERVGKKEGAEIRDAAYHSRVVIEVLQQAVSGGEIDDIKSQLPDDYHRLFEAGSTGELPTE